MSQIMQAVTSALSGAGFNMDVAQTIEARRELEDNLQKALSPLAALGYQTPPGMSTEDLSPLLTQSIDPALAKVTAYDETDYVFWKMLPKAQAKQTMHEIRLEIFHGDRFIDMASSEGNAGINDFTTLGTDFVKIKFWAGRREMSNVAADLPSGGHLVNGSLLSYYTEKTMIQLGRRLELDCLFGDTALNDLQTDGVIKQIVAAGRYEDLAGKQLTFDRIQRRIAKLHNIDVGGRPSVLLVTPDVWADLEIQAQDGRGRYQADGDIKGRNFVYGATGMQVFDPASSNRKIEVVRVPFLNAEAAYGSPFKVDGTTLYPRNSPDTSTPAPDNPVISSQPANAVNAASKFTADDAGAYFYHIIAVGEGGHSVAVETQAVTVAKGESVTILLNQDSTYSAGKMYYHVFRSAKNDTKYTSKYLFSTAYNTDGAGAKVQIVDHNAQRPGCSWALLLNLRDEEELAFYRLLPLARIPLAKVKLTVPFTIFMTGAVKVKVPQKQFLWKNCGVANPL